MSTAALVRELGELYCQAVFDGEWDDSENSRWRRVAREVCRRDYAERPHGRRCTCAECVHLLELWQDSGRRRGGIDPTAVAEY